MLKASDFSKTIVKVRRDTAPKRQKRSKLWQQAENPEEGTGKDTDWRH
jgi:hypothetical protein